MIKKVTVQLSLYEADLIRILREVDFGEIKISMGEDKLVRIKKKKTQPYLPSEPYQVIIERSELLTPEGGLNLSGAIAVNPNKKDDAEA